MEKQLKYVVLGAGGTGGPIGGYLTRAGKDVTLIARGRHLEAMKSGGLEIELGEEHFLAPVKACSMEEYKETPDVIFVCVKGYSLDEAAGFIKRTADPHTVVIPILNIYGTGGKLQEMLPDLTVTDGCIYIASQIKEPGKILMSGKIFRVVYGLRKGTPEETVEKVMPVLKTIEADLKEARILPVLSSNIERDALEKFSFVSPMAAVGSCWQVSARVMQPGGEKRETFIELIREIQRIASAMGVALPEGMVDINLKIMDDLAPTATASMQRDIAAGKQSEVDGLIYQVVRLGEEYQVEVPVYKEIGEKLRERLGN